MSSFAPISMIGCIFAPRASSMSDLYSGMGILIRHSCRSPPQGRTGALRGWRSDGFRKLSAQLAGHMVIGDAGRLLASLEKRGDVRFRRFHETGILDRRQVDPDIHDGAF